MDDLISRQAAIDARRYTFGNDEFSLEAAYHDCKLVFDGITGDDSFQEADTGLILYYANEIIYALQEALEGKDTNVPTNDHISRQAAIDALHMHLMYRMGTDSNKKRLDDWINGLPSVQPERKMGKWIYNSPVTMKCDQCGYVIKDWRWAELNFCANCGADMRGEQDE